MRDLLADRDLRRLVKELRDHGFVEVDHRGANLHLRRTVGHRDDHVRVEVDGAGWLGRLSGRRPVVRRVLLGQVWQLVEQSFSRPVPATPAIPDDVHVAVDLANLVPGGRATPDAARAVVEWMNQATSPAAVLEADRVDDAVLAVEFAAVARDRERGEVAARQATTMLATMQGGQRSLARRLEVAVDRLP